MKAIVCECKKREQSLIASCRELSHALMGSDDFANYASRIPAVYFFLHTNNNEKNIIASNHNPQFDVDESVLWEGVAAYVSIAKKFLSLKRSIRSGLFRFDIVPEGTMSLSLNNNSDDFMKLFAFFLKTIA